MCSTNFKLLNQITETSISYSDKVKFSLEQAMKAQRVSRGIALPFHDLGA